jgi:hypothetical protein
MAWYRPRAKVFQAVRINILARASLGPACFSEYPDWLARAFEKGQVRFADAHPDAGGVVVVVSVKSCFDTRNFHQIGLGDWIVSRGERGVQPVRAATFRARFEEA